MKNAQESAGQCWRCDRPMPLDFHRRVVVDGETVTVHVTCSDAMTRAGRAVIVEHDQRTVRP